MLSVSISNAVKTNMAVNNHMMSHDQDDEVFSPISTDDEHMKHLEKVSYFYQVHVHVHVHVHVQYCYMYM